MERVTARDSARWCSASAKASSDQVDSERSSCAWSPITPAVLSREVGADIYQLIKFKRSNQNTCISQKPLFAWATA